MPRLLMRTWGTASFCGDPMTGDCDCAVLEVTPELLARLKAWGERFRLLKLEESCACELVEYGMPLDVYSYVPVDELVDEETGPAHDSLDYENDGWCLLPPVVDMAKFADHAQRTEGECLHVRGYFRDVNQLDWVPEFYWSFLPKHGDCRVETPQFELSQLESYLRPVCANWSDDLP